MPELILLIAKFAPMLASAASSKYGQMIISLIAEAFGADAHNLQDIMDKIAGHEDSASKLAELEKGNFELLQELLFKKQPTKIDLQVSISYD